MDTEYLYSVMCACDSELCAVDSEFCEWDVINRKLSVNIAAAAALQSRVSLKLSWNSTHCSRHCRLSERLVTITASTSMS